MLIFSQDGQTVFDTTGGAIYIEPWRTGQDMDVVKYSVYGLGSIGTMRLATTDTMQSAKNIIKAINVLASLGAPAIDLDDDIDAFVEGIESNKDKYYEQAVQKWLSK